ncbi:ATP-binding protein [Enterocloster asparagiformis]|uniref:ATP-binding protein n=2 Tax=Enterocloster asparagiformis TaxID=333367 RepID=UPI000464B252|nr:transporter substrate-binding domain-containing protein [Enterocloster asparagiformis]
MRKKKCRWVTYLAAGLLAGLLGLWNTGTASAQVEEPRPLRVAFSQMEGLSETDQYGRHKGLIVDYLDEIAKYTGWEYEYIPVENDDIISNFLEGQYDLMGGTFYSSGFEEYFAYPDYNTGRSRAVLLCRWDDDRLLGYDLATLNGKTIGVYDRAGDKIRHLKEFLASNDLECRLKYYTYEDMQDGSLYEKLRSGEVDMLLGNDLETGGEFRMVASFQAQPYYIVTTVGNTEILEELNTALRYILESTPNFADQVYYANFPDLKLADIQLNDSELRYIEEKGTVTVAIPMDWHPIYCKGGGKELHDGVLPDLLREITAFTGLQFTFLYGDNYADCIRMVQQGEADILGAYLGENEQAFGCNLALSQPYMDLNNIVIKYKSVSYPGEGLTCGILNGRILPDSFQAEEIRGYDTVPELLGAVNAGEVDYIYGVSAMLEQELQNHRYLNVTPVTQESDSTDVAFAVLRPVRPELLTVLNKAIGNIPTEEKAVMLNQSLVSVGYTSLSLQELFYSNPLACILILSCALIFIMSVILMSVRSRMRNALLQSRLEAAEAKSTAKSVFLSQMSHEIRTPMNAIIGLTDLTCKERDVPPEIEKKLKKIRSSSQYLLALINDILDMSRIENGKMEIEQKDFSLSLVLQELQSMMSTQAEQKGLEFQVDFYVSHDWLAGDPVRLRQVLINLLSNAVKFTPAGGKVTLRVNEQSCGEEMEYRFSVQDTGVGIPYEDQERIFSSFEQLRPSISHSAGTGLGLPISRNIARLMGGDLEVKSEPGKGSEFYMTLRFPKGANVPPSPEPAGQENVLEGMKVLLAEDNDLNAEIAQELLAMAGVAVCRAANGQEAVDRFCAGPPGEFQAVLMDIRMPVKNGHEAAREIRASGRPDANVPIIAMTANTFKEDEEEARASGMNGFVPKPIDPDRLFTALRQHAPH